MLIRTIAFLLIVGFCLTASAQKQKPINVKQTARFRPPVLKTVLGTYTNNKVVSITEAKTILALPLKITDANNVPYKIVTYQFLFRRKGIVENEQTGKIDSSNTVVSDHFQNTPLPTLWITNINEEGFVKGEEFFYFDIIVQDEQGRKFFAPDLKIKIQ